MEVETKHEEPQSMGGMSKAEWIEHNPLRVWRKEHGITQQDLSYKLGVGLRAVASWELGEVNPTITNMGEIIDLTGDAEMFKKWREWQKLRETIAH